MIKLSFHIIRDAFHQAWNNKKNYTFLSVTIILTFSIIGFYMIYNDSQIYNTYKNVQKESRNIAFVQYDKTDQNKVALLLSKLNEMENTYYYLTSEYTGISIYDKLSQNVSFRLIAKIIPNNVWAYYWGNGYRAELLDGSKSFSLKNDEVIICESLYELLKGSENSDGELFLEISPTQKLKVKNVCYDFGTNNKVIDENGNITYYFYCLISDECLENKATINPEIVVYSENVCEVESYATDLGLRFSSFYREKLEMNEKILSSIEIKKIVLLALMLILGINMLSCFMNALNERKYEISIRRALGASKQSIILQFLTEGMIVIVIDILISIGVIIWLLSLIKIYMEIIVGQEWIINITSYSITIFCLCCSFLALFFSGLFAVLSTRVEIIKYIKGE